MENKTTEQLLSRNQRIRRVSHQWLKREYPGIDYDRYALDMANYEKLPKSLRVNTSHPKLQYKSKQNPTLGVSSNIVLKIVGDTGTSYVVPIPDYQRFEREMKEHQMAKDTATLNTSPKLHYFNSNEIRMSDRQRKQQRLGQLPGCIYNRHVPPIGDRPQGSRGKMMGTTFPDADTVMQQFLVSMQSNMKKEEE